MLSHILRRLLHVPKSGSLPSIQPFNKAFHSDRSASANFGIHNVNVTGKVESIHHQTNDNVSFFLKSINAGNFSKMHKISVSGKNATLLDIVKTKLKQGQSVSVEGKMYTKRYTTDDGKHRQLGNIAATQVNIIASQAVAGEDSSLQTELPDVNLVEIAGTISTDVIGTNFKAFTLATVRNSNMKSTKANNLCFNRIFVYDESLFPILEGAKTKEDTFLVRGELSYKIYKNDVGQMKTSCFIRATQLYKV